MTGLAKLVDVEPAKADDDEDKQDEDDEDDEDEETSMDHDAITKGLEGLDPKAKVAVEAIFKAADERAEKAEKRAHKAEETTAELAKALTTERDARINKEMIEKAQKNYGALGSPEVIGAVLKTLHDLDSKAADVIEQLLTSANERVEKSALFTEAGHAGGGESAGGAWAQIQKAAAVFKAADPKMTEAAAQAAATSATPSQAAFEPTSAARRTAGSGSSRRLRVTATGTRLASRPGTSSANSSRPEIWPYSRPQADSASTFRSATSASSSAGMRRCALARNRPR